MSTSAKLMAPSPGRIGLGLGLAIVHHLVELQCGTVCPQSPGGGQGAICTKGG